MNDPLQVQPYSYAGSWASNFNEFSESRNLQTFGLKYKHIKERCLSCSLKVDPVSGASFFFLFKARFSIIKYTLFL